MSKFVLVLVVVLVLANTISALISSNSQTLVRKQAPRVGPVFENFFLDIGEDPAANTPRLLYGEVNYKNFVESYKPDALLIGGGSYNIIQRIRELKLLSLTVDSGLLDALESKGITLSKLEALLPLADDLNVLPTVASNKDTLLGLAPLIIEPAPLLIPIVVSILKTSPAALQLPGLVLILTGAYEFIQDSGFLGGVEVLLGAPLLVLGTLLGSLESLPSKATIRTASASSSSSSPAPKGEKVVRSTARVTTSEQGGQNNGKRKVIKIRKVLKADF